MKTLIIGDGEIGKSLLTILDEHYPCDIIDKGVRFVDEYEIMHICFPYSDEFVEYVKSYQEQYKPKYTVIHSTVPIGTSAECNAIHSPCIGIHPHLEESLKVFNKFLGGKQASEVAQYFRRAGIRVYITDNSDSTELMKIMSTTYYGMCIEYTKEVKRQCDYFGIPFELWTIWTDNYNVGYQKLGYPEYTRPNLIPMMTKIGGHCVRPNLELLESPFTKFLKELNEVKRENGNLS